MAETSRPSPAFSGKGSTGFTAFERLGNEQTQLSHIPTSKKTTVASGDSSDNDTTKAQPLCGDRSFRNGIERAPLDEATHVEASLADLSQDSGSLSQSQSSLGAAVDSTLNTSGAASSSSAANAKDVLSTNSVSRSTSIARNSTSISLSSAANGHLHTELPETESPYQYQYGASKRPRLSSNESNTI